jgi:CBS domain-containing membrane protein
MDSTLRTVADAMTRKIVTVTEKDALEKLEEGMERLRFRHLPVVDANGKLVGLLTHSDIRHASSSFLSERETDRNAIINQVPVGRVMQHEVVTVHPDDLLVEAGKIMWESKIGCLPVVDSEGSLVGIITAADFIRVALHFLGSDVAKVDVDELARKARSPNAA